MELFSGEMVGQGVILTHIYPDLPRRLTHAQARKMSPEDMHEIYQVWPFLGYEVCVASLGLQPVAAGLGLKGPVHTTCSVQLVQSMMVKQHSANAFRAQLFLNCVAVCMCSLQERITAFVLLTLSAPVLIRQLSLQRVAHRAGVLLMQSGELHESPAGRSLLSLIREHKKYLAYLSLYNPKSLWRSKENGDFNQDAMNPDLLVCCLMLLSWYGNSFINLGLAQSAFWRDCQCALYSFRGRRRRDTLAAGCWVTVHDQPSCCCLYHI